ncbi:MAG TPA: hypothetical protein VJP40_01170 [bacterium]|nr:hypothetical protein [bacterium]
MFFYFNNPFRHAIDTGAFQSHAPRDFEPPQYNIGNAHIVTDVNANGIFDFKDQVADHPNLAETYSTYGSDWGPYEFSQMVSLPRNAGHSLPDLERQSFAELARTSIETGDLLALQGAIRGLGHSLSTHGQAEEWLFFGTWASLATEQGAETCYRLQPNKLREAARKGLWKGFEYAKKNLLSCSVSKGLPLTSGELSQLELQARMTTAVNSILDGEPAQAEFLLQGTEGRHGPLNLLEARAYLQAARQKAISGAMKETRGLLQEAEKLAGPQWNGPLERQSKVILQRAGVMEIVNPSEVPRPLEIFDLLEEAQAFAQRSNFPFDYDRAESHAVKLAASCLSIEQNGSMTCIDLSDFEKRLANLMGLGVHWVPNRPRSQANW